MNVTLIKTISEMVEQACASERNKIGYELWKSHIKPMIPIARELAVVHKADEEIVTLAVLLHDLAEVEDIAKREFYPNSAAQRAREVLAMYQYPVDKTELVARCIQNHTADLNIPEEQCVADAHELIKIVDIPSLFYDAYHHEHLGIAEGKNWVESCWAQVSPLSQSLYQDRYTLARQLTQGNVCKPYSYETDLERTLSELVEKACMSEKNVYGYGMWENHICPMVPIGNALSELHGADAEIVRIAILLHDLAGIEDYSKAADHHIHGAQRAKHLLQEAGYPSDKTDLVARCILHHRGSVILPKETPEERCLADADAVAHISDLPSLFFMAYEKKGLGFEDGKKWVKKKILRDWQKMSEIARQSYCNQYDAIMHILVS
jgi:uncharacterized protein